MKLLSDIAWFACFVFLAVAAFALAVENVAAAWIKLRSINNG